MKSVQIKVQVNQSLNPKEVAQMATRMRLDRRYFSHLPSSSHQGVELKPAPKANKIGLRRQLDCRLSIWLQRCFICTLFNKIHSCFRLADLTIFQGFIAILPPHAQSLQATSICLSKWTQYLRRLDQKAEIRPGNDPDAGCGANRSDQVLHHVLGDWSKRTHGPLHSKDYWVHWLLSLYSDSVTSREIKAGSVGTGTIAKTSGEHS